MRAFFTAILLSAVLSLNTALRVYGRDLSPKPRTDGGSDQGSIESCATSKVVVRFPPSLASPSPPTATTPYKPMPDGWMYATWYFTYSSQLAYQQWVNIQWNLFPIFPQSSTLPGQIHDFTAYQTKDDPTIKTFYAVDTPKRSVNKTLGPEWDDVFDYAATGKLAAWKDTWEFISWGYDTDGFRYVVLFETPIATLDTTPAIDILSTSKTGPSCATLDAIKLALHELNSPDLSQLVDGIQILVQNGGRRGFGPVVCDVACMNNEGA